MASDTINIVCFGNELHGDDGFGPAIHRRLAELTLPPGVRALRADVGGLAALGCFENCRRAIVVDALAGFGPPGSLHLLDPDDIAPESGAQHGQGLRGLLRLLPAAIASPPQVQVVGVEMAAMQPFSPGLSEVVAARLDAAVEQVQALIR